MSKYLLRNNENGLYWDQMREDWATVADATVYGEKDKASIGNGSPCGCCPDNKHYLQPYEEWVPYGTMVSVADGELMQLREKHRKLYVALEEVLDRVALNEKREERLRALLEECK